MTAIGTHTGLARKLWAVVRFGLLALLIALLTGGLWSGLLVANLASGLAIPWAALVMALLLWLIWEYLDGRGAPLSTSAARHELLRARRLTVGVFAWALLAGLLAVVALVGFWIVLFQLVKAPGNPLPDLSNYPRLPVLLALAMAGVVGGVSEEAAFRGYFQSVLEREFGGAIAIVVGALVMAPAHGLTQGFVWTTLLFYFCVDVIFGMLAYLTKSILPGIIVHAIGLFVFFSGVWPYDATRPLVSQGGADAGFWLSLGVAVVFGVLALLAFQRLAALAGPVDGPGSD